MDFDLGARLRQLRETHGLSQRELAKRAGVTNGTISMIEQNRTSPAVGSLKKVLDGIPISMADFFAGDLLPKSKVFFKKSDLTELSKGKISYSQVGRDLAGKAIQFMHEVYEPGADTGRSMLSHEGEEVGIVVEGALEVTIGSEKKILQAGEAFYFESTTPHRFRCAADRKTVVITASTPPSF